jgi:hypothetical protein
MPDLTLHEYRDMGFSDQEIAWVLKKEARQICGIDYSRNETEKTVGDLHHFLKKKIPRRSHKKYMKVPEMSQP